jgi:hypothetical protein
MEFQLDDIVTRPEYVRERDNLSDWKFDPRGTFGMQLHGMNPKKRKVYVDRARVVEVHPTHYVIEWEKAGVKEELNKNATHNFVFAH